MYFFVKPKCNINITSLTPEVSEAVYVKDVSLILK